MCGLRHELAGRGNFAPAFLFGAFSFDTKTV
jgi:hypothetical protein